MERSKRKEKVFIDWSQNTASKTTVAVYSVRALPAAERVNAGHVGRAGRRPVRPGTPARLAIRRRDQVLERVERHGDLHAPVLEVAPGAAAPRRAPTRS